MKSDVEYSVKTYNDSFLLSRSEFDRKPKKAEVKGNFISEKI